MESCKLNDDEKLLFKYISDGNINEVKRIINDLKVSVNCYDDQGMTPLHHAAFKGSFDLCKLLLDCGSDVNADRHVYGYSALCLAALSNHCETVSLLLEHGANATARTSNKRTASEMAAFVGNRKTVNVINNYLSKDFVDYFTEAHGLEDEPKLPMFLSGAVHKLVIMPNIHPVRLVLYLQSNNILFQHLNKIVNVLNLLSEKQLKEVNCDKFSVKFHHIGFVFSSVLEFICAEKKSTDGESVSDQKMLERLIKSWLKGKDNCGISINLEKFIRKDISAYPYSDCLLFQQISSAISMTELGHEPNALSILFNAINGPHSYNELECCATCGNQSAEKKCSACKSVQYCDKTCQKLHWFIHKSECKKH